MDGVVADYRARAVEIIGYDLADPNAMYPDSDWALLQGERNLFSQLPKTGQADQLVVMAREFRDQLGWELLFLTAIPHNNDMPWAFYDKVMWANNYYPDIPVMFGPYSTDKARQCHPGDILVDDRTDNCASWRAAGGRSILVTPSGDLSSALVELGSVLEELREAQQR
jgi:hypothetical protein